MNNYRLDNVPGTDFKIFQQKGHFSYTTDAIVLSGFANPKGKVIDLGAGSGILSLRALAYKNVESVVSVEKNKIAYELLDKTIKYNGLNQIISSHNMGINEIINHYGKGVFKTVITNPPYFLKGGAITKVNQDKNMAMHETDCELSNWLEICSDLLVPRGALFMIQRPQRIQDIMYFLRIYKLEAKEIRFVKDRVESLAKTVLIKAIKNGGNGTKLLKDLILFDENGEMTKEYSNYYHLKHINKTEV